MPPLDPSPGAGLFEPRQPHPVVWAALGCAVLSVVLSGWRTAERYTAVDAHERRGVVDDRQADADAKQRALQARLSALEASVQDLTERVPDACPLGGS